MNWKKLSQKRVWNGYRKIDECIFKLPSGLELEFEIRQDSDVVCILPITKQGTVLLVKQFRPGPEKELIELPAGFIDTGENPQDAARREFLEETGYAGNYNLVCTTYEGAYSIQKRYHCLITDCEKVKEPENNEREPIELVEMPLDEFRKHLRAGGFSNVETGYLGLDYLAGLTKTD